jgi:hypothetical protein
VSAAAASASSWVTAPQRARDHQGETAVKKTTEKTRTHFTFRIDTWTKPDALILVEHVAGVEDYELALASFRAACERWPGTPISIVRWIGTNQTDWHFSPKMNRSVQTT